LIGVVGCRNSGVAGNGAQSPTGRQRDSHQIQNATQRGERVLRARTRERWKTAMMSTRKKRRRRRKKKRKDVERYES